MSQATYRLRIDWEGKGTYGGSADVTARTFSCEWSRGRDFASQLTGRSQAGQFSAILNNESGDYSPFNTASPLTGSLLPGRKVQLTGTISGTSYDLWQGYLLRIMPEPDAKDINTVKVEAIGPLGYLNQKQVSIPMLTSVNTGTVIGTILDEAGWASADRVVDGGNSTLERFWTERIESLNALRYVEDTEAGFLTESKDGKVVFEKRQHRLVSPHTESQATFSDVSNITLVYIGVAQEDPLPQIFNILETSITDFTVGSLATLWTLAETGTASPKIDRDGTLVLWAQYPNADSASEDIAVDAWTTPVATTDYTASASAGAGTELTSEVSATAEKFANSMMITLTNDSSTSDVYLTKLQARGTPVSQADAVIVSAEDVPSQTLYGERTYPNPAQFISDSAEGLDWCRYHLNVYKDPLPIVAISLNANRDNTHLVQALSKDISDRITIVGTGNAGLGVNEDFFIEAEHHGIDSHRNHIVTWECSQALKFSDFWVLNVSKLDTQTRLAY